MKDDAQYYQDHKDDEDEWGDAEPAPKRSESRRLGAMVSVRFSPVEVEQVRRAAKLEGQSLSGYVRNAALNLSVIPTILPIVGAPIFGTVNLGQYGDTQVSYDQKEGSETRAFVA